MAKIFTVDAAQSFGASAVNGGGKSVKKNLPNPSLSTVIIIDIIIICKALHLTFSSSTV